MTSDQVSGLVRHLLTTLGGILVVKGTVDEATMMAVAGAVATLAGFAWSFFSKKKVVVAA